MDSKPIYKTAEELGIEQWEHDGLVALVGPLSRGERRIKMRHVSAFDDGCGTAACIGGWLLYLYGRPKNYMLTQSGACNLFYPDLLFRPVYVEPTSAQAARAIVNFLVTGDPQWDAVVASP